MEPMKEWRVRVIREGRPVDIGQVSETSELLARCAALSRFGVADEDIASGERLPAAAIYPDDDFEVVPTS